MANLSLSDILRLLATGFVIILVAYVCEPAELKNLFSTIGGVTIPLLAFVFGSIFFLVYRTILYNFIFLNLIALFQGDNLRSRLMQKYVFKNKMEAENFWSLIRRSKLEKEEWKVYILDSSGVHFLYMTFISTFLGGIYMLYKYFSSENHQLGIIISIFIMKGGQVYS